MKSGVIAFGITRLFIRSRLLITMTVSGSCVIMSLEHSSTCFKYDPSIERTWHSATVELNQRCRSHGSRATIALCDLSVLHSRWC
jgi:hypothetical protein